MYLQLQANEYQLLKGYMQQVTTSICHALYSYSINTMYAYM